MYVYFVVKLKDASLKAPNWVTKIVHMAIPLLQHVA